jgi:hypothetical protein
MVTNTRDNTLLSRHQNAGQNHDLKIANRVFENIAQFKYLGTTVTNQNLIQKEIKRRLNSGNAYYHSVQKPLSSRLLSKNVNLYGCESWSLTLREEHRLRVFEKGVLRRIFGLKTDEVPGRRKILHNEELHNLYSSPSVIRMNKSKRMRWAGYVARMGEKRKAYRMLVEKPEGMRPLGRPIRRWVDTIKMHLRGIEWGGMEWIDRAEDMGQWRALVNTVIT